MKAVLILIALMIVAHLIRPLGLPGLRRRGDAWKIAVLGLALLGLTVLVGTEAG